MDEQDVKVILPPDIDAETPEANVPPPQAEAGFGIFRALRQLLPMVLLGVSLLFFSCTAVTLFSAIGIKASDVGRIILGEFAGGMKNITYTTGSNPLSNSHSSLNSGQDADEYIPGTDAISHPQPDYSDYVIGLNNETPYTPNMTEILSRSRAIQPLAELQAQYGADAPLVLIIHTHGSEGYIDSATSSYRTSNKERNVVAIGKIIADALNSAGITTLHCDTLFDAEDFNMAYYNSSLEIRKTIAEYPSIAYIIDVHRDSVTLDDGTHIPLKCTVDGQTAAQLMFVMGTDHGGSGHVGWQDNLALSARLQYSIKDISPSMMRNINLRSASFNQQYKSGSILLEVGSAGNSLEEAKISAKVFADTLIREIIGN